MPGTSSRRSAGFTLVELLVVIAIIAVLMSLLLPALQRVRESASRAACQNNLRQLGLGLQNYAHNNRTFPPGGVGAPFRHGWAIYVLPYIDEDNLYKLYDFRANWSDAVNQPVVNQQVKLMVCPSSPPGRLDMGTGWTAAVGDYSPIAEVDSQAAARGFANPALNYRGIMTLAPANAPMRPAEITDGSSQTILLAEDAGRPQLWRAGQLNSAGPFPLGAGWGDYDNFFTLHGFSLNGVTLYGPCAINCTNNNEIYGFHAAGANVVLADGAVRLLSSGVSTRTAAALTTAQGGETIQPNDY